MPLTSISDALKQSRSELLEWFQAPENVLVSRYAPGKWTVRQILCHLADAEMVYLWRLSRAIAEPGARVEGFDQDAWAEGLNYQERSLEVCRLLFDGARMQVLYYIEGLRADLLEQTVEHSERGTLTLLQLFQTLADHTCHHLGQIKAAAEGKS